MRGSAENGMCIGKKRSLLEFCYEYTTEVDLKLGFVIVQDRLDKRKVEIMKMQVWNQKQLKRVLELAGKDFISLGHPTKKSRAYPKTITFVVLQNVHKINPLR